MAKIQELYQDSLLFLGVPSRELDADLFLFFYLLFFFSPTDFQEEVSSSLHELVSCPILRL